MNHTMLDPIHPGEVLQEEFLKPFKLSPTQIANDIDVPPQVICDIVAGNSAITADIALRLSHYFQTSPHFWLGLQTDYDLDLAKEQLGDRQIQTFVSNSIETPS